MLDIRINTLCGKSVDGIQCDHTAKNTVLRIVLKVTSGKCTSVNIHSRGIGSENTAVRILSTLSLTNFFRQLLIPGLCDQKLGGISSTINTNVPVIQSGSTVGILCANFSNRINANRLETAKVYHVDHIIHGKLIQKVLPHCKIHKQTRQLPNARTNTDFGLFCEKNSQHL